jgi:steroid 5-alpha reductase family enzyme
LGSHIVFRTLRGGDDPRYAALREEWGADAPRRLFWFLQIQAAVALLLALCVGLAARNPAPAFRPLDWLGFGVILAGLVGEGVADAQLRRFGAQHAGRSAVCDEGLWGFSRHPNYFFQWLGWLGYALLAIDLDAGYLLGWLALAAPIAMYALLVHVSGIPPLEAHMLHSRGKAFVAYQRRVSAFWPLPAKVRAETAQR